MPAIDRESFPATDTSSFTSRGFGVAATSDNVSGTAPGRTFFSSIGIMPLATSGGSVRCSRSTLLFLALLPIADGDHARAGVDGHLERALEGGAPLDGVIADEPEVTVLREDGGLVADGSVREPEHEA